jgi:putative hemolysin
MQQLRPSAVVTSQISYAASARTRGGRLLIRAVENATGRLSLIRRATGFEDDLARGRSLWDVLVDRYGLSIELLGGSLSNIPAEGPLVVIANHPYGILDGLMMGHMLDRRRGGDFRILANSVFVRAGALDRVVLPISFDETPEALRLNLATRARALDYLGQGGAIGVFPGGTVSTSARPFGPPLDPCWRNFTARMIAKSGATVVPIWFEGHNSRLFQLASHLHQTLRLALLVKEFRARVGCPVRMVVGDPIPPADLARHRGDATALMDHLRRATYDLAPEPLGGAGYGFEFEAKYRG